MAMVAMMTTMMGHGASRNHRPNQNDERDGSKKKRAQLHDRAPSQPSHSFKWSVSYMQRIPTIDFSHYLFPVMFRA
jgi:hypothetical protein